MLWPSPRWEPCGPLMHPGEGRATFGILQTAGLGAPEAMPFHHMHLHKRSQRQSLQLLPITLQDCQGHSTKTDRHAGQFSA
jgi:hypothetical protein